MTTPRIVEKPSSTIFAIPLSAVISRVAVSPFMTHPPPLMPVNAAVWNACNDSLANCRLSCQPALLTSCKPDCPQTYMAIPCLRRDSLLSHVYLVPLRLRHSPSPSPLIPVQVNPSGVGQQILTSGNGHTSGRRIQRSSDV